MKSETLSNNVTFSSRLIHPGVCTLLSAAFLLLSSPLMAATDAEQGLQDCRQIEDRGQRIACLEDLLEAFEESSDHDAAAAAPPSSVPAQPTRQLAEDEEAEQTRRAARFGLGSTRIQQDDKGQDELLDTVARVEESSPDYLLITLEGGQVWQQVHPRRYNLRKGDSIRIYSTRWGKNYRLESESLSGFIQVLRVE